MSFKFSLATMPLGILLCLTGQASLAAAELDEIVIWGEIQNQRSGPTRTLTPQDLTATNVVTTEDLVKYEPGLIIRRRFIGDANGTMGIRGANMFQTSRSMVFADGVPLHNLLQSRWDGAPRWSMIAASEIEQIEVLYGPYSAEYSGNAMGGVVLMESRIPQQQEIHFDSMYFSQDFSAYGRDEILSGYKSFLSYGNRFDQLSLYVSLNRLQNTAQAQSYFMGAAANGTPTIQVSGGIHGKNERGQGGIYFGDSGNTDTATDNFKLKLGYEFGNWAALLNLAYEDRSSEIQSPGNYLLDSQGIPVWEGNVVQDGQFFSVPASRFSVSSGYRHSLSGGLRIRGTLSSGISLESNLSWFDVLEDENRSSARNPRDPAYTATGQVSDLGDSGWRTAEIKIGFSDLGVEGLSLFGGLRHEQYELNIDVYASEDYRSGLESRYNASSGGKTELNAAYVQAHWDQSASWAFDVGVRLEDWHSMHGYYDKVQPDTALFDLVQVPERSKQQTSPKFSLSYFPDDAWTVQYSVAKAYRFPIVEELFSQYRAFNAVNSANPELAPENGLHQNLSLHRQLALGDLQLSIYRETIREVIEAQSLTLAGGVSVRTFLPVSEVKTRGIELASNLNNIFLEDLDLRFNLSYTHAEISRNQTDPSIIGKRYPRMPSWRANLLLDYQLTHTLGLGAGLRYASNSYGQLDNSDHESGVYGAQDDFLFANIKADWRLNPDVRVSFGVDNLFNKIAYVAHPWPARTLFLELAMEL